MNWKLVIRLGCSFLLFGFRPAIQPVPESSSLTGIWKGGFGNQKEVHPAVVHLKEDNQLDFYEGADVRSTGTYQLSGDTVLIIRINRGDYTEQVQMTGRLDKAKHFIDGVWKKDNEEGGSFYLQKQF